MIPFACVPTARHGWTGGQRESAGFNTLRLPVQFDDKPELVPVWEAVEVILPNDHEVAVEFASPTFI